MNYRFAALTLLGLVLASSVLLAAPPQAPLRPLPRVYFDITSDGRKLGRIVIELRRTSFPRRPRISAPCAPANAATVTR